MATNNVTNWGVSYIDENGVYVGNVTGDVTGQVFGTSALYVADGAIDASDSIVQLNAALASTVMTLANGTSGQDISLFCTDATETCTVLFSGISPALNLLTFSAAGDAATLRYFDDGAGNDYWVCTSLVGTAAIS